MTHRIAIGQNAVIFVIAGLVLAASIAAETSAATAQQAVAPLALRGLDPVLLIEGREEKGKEEIAEVHKGRRYLFLSASTHNRFKGDPDRYAIRNDTCPVVDGAPVDLPSALSLRRIVAALILRQRDAYWLVAGPKNGAWNLGGIWIDGPLSRARLVT